MFERVYYRRTGLDPERDFQQRTLQNMPASNNLYVVKVDRRYYYTEHEVKVQVFNDMCKEPYCQGPISEPVTIFSGSNSSYLQNPTFMRLVDLFY